MGSSKKFFFWPIAGEKVRDSNYEEESTCCSWLRRWKGALVKELCGSGAESPHPMADSKMGTSVLHLQGIGNIQQSE